ncbi:MAG: hypothetical protein JEZ08_01860 [Clostridiales bacterium]|nr:hypothetical protein [Clostridiales bacterium]
MITKFKNALTKLYTEDKYLIDAFVNERSITHKLGCYLQEEYDTYNVDCEYNRNILDPKSITKKIYMDLTESKNILPDIIVHERGTNDRNHLIVECKKNNNRDYDQDREKLKYYTISRNDNLGYDYGIFLVLSRGINSKKLDGSITIYQDSVPKEKYYYYWRNNQIELEKVKLPKYKMIQDSIKDKIDKTVKTCWIADVKEQLGLPIRIANNRIDVDKRTNPCPREYKEFIVKEYKNYGCLED